MRTISQSQFESEGLTLLKEAPGLVSTPQGAIPLLPDKGFEFNPGKAIWQPDPDKYPADLWSQLETLLKEE